MLINYRKHKQDTNTGQEKGEKKQRTQTTKEAAITVQGFEKKE